MRIYEAVLYDRPAFGDPHPVILEGREVAREFAAESAGKARYQFYLDLKECIDDVRFQDIRVRSLSREAARPMGYPGWEERLDTINQIIRVIGSYGRHFLSENSDRRDLVSDPFFAHFLIDKRNELWYVDRHTRKPILVRHQDWPGFSDGGTLRSLIQHFANYIRGGAQIEMRLLGPWPGWISGGDPWGYGEDMQKVRDRVVRLLQPAAEPAA